MLLVYTHKITPRLKYIFKQICTRILGIPVDFTTTVEDFIAHDSLKMSYTRQSLGNEIFVRSHDLLFEQGISDLDIKVSDWEETKCFFANSDQSALPFDIFSASFYLLSRYEEYLPHVKDEFGRFTALESLAYKHQFLEQPVVDIWAFKFLKVVQAQFPDYQFQNRKYSIRPVIDVPMAYDYKYKGIMRTVGGTFKDLFSFKFKDVYKRYMVILGFKNDPYDTFRYIVNRQKYVKQKFIFFFLVGDFSTYDKNNSVQKTGFVSLIKQVGDYCKVGLKSSLFAVDSKATLKMEKERLERIINQDIPAARQSYSKLNLPETYRNLTELEISEDFTMGYINHVGFRAGTCTPFFFFDLDYEIQTPLRINTYHVLDFALLKHHSLLDKKMILNRIITEVKKVNGEFVPVFHNYTFSNSERWKGYKELFNIIIDSTNE
ncbi:polysaccharide deacetylase family protein [Bizionia paragorgiae]|uniref:polysaccharide deacetylase family protein n=1 Tax=Bizionia paragorgiae TaxID=283786 RepID=UPI00299D11CD|nr:polysaccharide deacetylase family protein [Bizionia paragorgiae]MDX1270335.1 polysaccharide deacetylase family protein [Bizionia paragorgiae]